MRNILRVPEVCKFLSISKPTLFRWRRLELFPQPIRLGPNSVGWEQKTIEAWLAAKKPTQQFSIVGGSNE